MSRLKAAREMAKRIPLMRRGVWWLRGAFNAFLCRISPVTLVRLRYRQIRGSWPSLRNPQLFDEKLCWLMLFWHHPLKTQCGDKYAVRSYVEQNGLRHLLPPLLGVYESVYEIGFAGLPERFVLKCSHGCGCNIICRDKHLLDIPQAKRKLNKWMRTDYGRIFGEMHYSGMQPRIICEEYLGDESGLLPVDYKIYCFAGRAHCTLVCTERQLDGHGAKFDIYDREWKLKLPYDRASLLADRSIKKPRGYDEMIEAAEKLSKPFPFVRMDMYIINDKVRFGEMTFTPAGGMYAGWTEQCLRELGHLLRLPEKMPSPRRLALSPRP